MTIYSEQDAKAILDKAIKASVADECSATLGGSDEGNIRYALNSVSTSGFVSDCNLAVEVAFGKRTGTATTNRFDDASIREVVRRAEELAKLAPENPEFMPAIDKQSYRASATFNDKTAAVTPDYRASVAAACIEPCRKDKLTAAGFFTDSRDFMATANSKGNFGYQKSSDMDFTCTVRTDDGKGSGWVARNLGDVGQFDVGSDIRTAMDKARRSVDARALEPGKYTVIMEPAATAGLISFMMFNFDARQADEGRSFLSKKGGGNKLGDKLFDERVTMIADP